MTFLNPHPLLLPLYAHTSICIWGQEMLNLREHLHTYYMYDPKYIMYVLLYCFELEDMHGIPLYE